MIEIDLQKKIAALKEKMRNEVFLTNYNLITENEEEFNKHAKELTQAIENLKRLSEAIKVPEEKRERSEETMKNETEENITKLRETMISKDIESILSDTRFFELFLEAYREKGIPDCEIIKQEEVEMIIRNLGQTIKRIDFEIEHDPERCQRR